MHLVHNARFRTSLHYFPYFSFIDGVKECGGYTVFLHLNTTEENSVGVHCFSPGVGKTRNEMKQETASKITTKPNTLKPSPNGAQYSPNVSSMDLTAPSTILAR